MPSLNRLTEDLGRIQVLHDMWRPDELIAGEPTVGVLQTEQDVHSIAQSVFGNQLRRIPTNDISNPIALAKTTELT